MWSRGHKKVGRDRPPHGHPQGGRGQVDTPDNPASGCRVSADGSRAGTEAAHADMSTRGGLQGTGRLGQSTQTNRPTHVHVPRGPGKARMRAHTHTHTHTHTQRRSPQSTPHTPRYTAMHTHHTHRSIHMSESHTDTPRDTRHALSQARTLGLPEGP